jgi:hypothetical protein
MTEKEGPGTDGANGVARAGLESFAARFGILKPNPSGFTGFGAAALRDAICRKRILESTRDEGQRQPAKLRPSPRSGGRGSPSPKPRVLLALDQLGGHWDALQ